MDNKKVVLITGASSGFGHQVAQALLGVGSASSACAGLSSSSGLCSDGGYIVCAAARRVEMMDDLAAAGAMVLGLDVTDADSCASCVEAVVARYGRVDVLVNNAGFGSYGTIEQVSMEQARYQFDVNVFGMAAMVRAVLPGMRERRSGQIINTSSVVGDVSMAGLGWYAATKHAVEAISVALRQEVRGLGIRVSLIKPGAVRTGFEGVMLKTLDGAVGSSDPLSSSSSLSSLSRDYGALMEGFRQFNVDMYRNAPGPDGTVRAVVRAIQARRPKFKYRTTSTSKMLPVAVLIMGGRVYDWLVLKLIFRGRR